MRETFRDAASEHERNVGTLRDVFRARLAERVHGAERLEELRAPCRAHARDPVEDAADAGAAPELPVVVEPEAMRLVAQALERAQRLGAARELEVREPFANDQLLLLRE